MKKNLSFLIIVSLFIVAASVLIARQDILSLDNTKTFIKKQRPAVAFPHGRHMNEIECLNCHHDYKDGKNVLSEDSLTEGSDAIKCAACHGLDNASGRHGLKNAFHEQCSGCHRKMGKEKKKTGPRLCAGCHPWKKQ